MSAYFAGFICALILASFVIAWIAYCMFFRERHKSEFYQYDISDLQHRNREMSTNEEKPEAKINKKAIAAGIFILPSRHKQKDDYYDKRPDYPESPVPKLQPGADKLVEIFADNATDADVHSKDVSLEIATNAAYHSDV